MTSGTARSVVDGAEGDELLVAGSRSSGLRSGLSLLRDLLRVARPMARSGFSMAAQGTDAGFAIGRAAATAPFHVAEAMGAPAAGPGAEAVAFAIDAARGLTLGSISFAEQITSSSIGATDGALDLAGVRDGEVYRRLAAHVESHAGTESHAMREALLGLAVLLAQTAGETRVVNPLELMAGGRALAAVHAAQRSERVQARAREGHAPPVLPARREILAWTRYMNFAAAAYGYQAAIVLDMVPEGVTLRSDREAVCALTGVAPQDVLTAVHHGELYRPGYFVALDHAHREVVIAVRGTMRPQDVLVDLVCESEPLVTVMDGDELMEGRVHRGFLRSAQRLAGELHEVTVEALRENPGYELVIAGHSLGGGVATLLTLMWARIPEFRDRNIRGVSFAAPCVACEGIARAPFTKRHVTSVVTGDDLVSRLGLGTFRQLQRSIERLAPLVSAGLDEQLVAHERAAAEDEGREEKLYCAGRVWWLHSEEYEPHPMVEINPVRELAAIELFPGMFGIHLPNAYVDALARLQTSDL